MLSKLSLLFFVPAVLLLWVPMLAIINGVYTGDQALAGILGLVIAAPGVILVLIDIVRNGWRKASLGLVGVGLLATPFAAAFALGGACDLTQRCGQMATPPELRATEGVKSSALAWTPSDLTADLSSAWVVGNQNDRRIFLVRSRLAKGGRVAPHSYAKERVIAVITGVLHFASGPEFDERALQRYEAGDVIRVPADVMHYFTAPDGEVTFDQLGMGPAPLPQLAVAKEE